MKQRLLLFVAAFLLVLPNVFAAAPADSVIIISSLPPHGYLLDKGWKFHPGDDPAFAGPGLGLSLTYDMMVRGHGGSIEVKSKDGERSKFLVALPTNQS